jgi:sulfide dehydrogenase cytochrome subunit
MRPLLAALACILVQAGAASAAEPPAGAASCSGCHAISRSVDTAVPRLQGRKADELTLAMREFKTGARPATVMGRLAKGFSDEEIAALSAWFAAQRD